MRRLLDRLRRSTANVLLGLAATAAASPWLGAWSGSFDLLAQFLLQAAAATFALLLVLLLVRRWRPALLAAACLAAQLAAVQPGLPSAVAAASPAIRVVWLNLWVDNPRRAATIAYLRHSDADVLVLSEIYGGWREAIGALADLYPHRVDCLDFPGCDVAILSRSPIVEHRSLRDRTTGASYVDARIGIGGESLIVAGTHLVRPLGNATLAQQVAQVRFVGDQLARRGGPRLLVGDFNAVPWARVMTAAAESSGLRLVRTVDGTWPAALPWLLRLPIDNALASQEIDVLARRNGPAIGSDHRPVIIDLRLPRPP